jgi:ribonucleoside-diphosphate reductase alpha chain
MGFMGLGSALMILGIKYGSNESVEFIDKVLNIMNFEAIKASILLSSERGSYKNCDWSKHFENVQRIFSNLSYQQLSELKQLAEKHKGFRNVALFTVPPTGNTGCLANNVSGGVEPIFALTTYRLVGVPEIPIDLKDKCPKFWEGDMKPNEFFKEKEMFGIKYLEYNDQDTKTLYKILKDRGLCKEVEIKDFAVDFIEKNNLDKSLIDKSSTAMNLTVDKHINILNVVAQHLDQSCSKTVNLPADYKYEDMMNLYLDAYKTGRIKGITTFRDGTRMAVLSDKKTDSKDCPCLKKTTAVKRPKELDCKLHLLNIKGVAYYVIISFIGDDPYEVFMAENSEDVIEDGEVVAKKVIFKNSMNGISAKLIKKGSKQYQFESDSFKFIISRQNESDEKATITGYSRIISCALRHGTPIQFLVEQMEKTEGSMAAPLKVITRVLKKYVKDGTVVSGEVCPECGGRIIRKEGCKSCENAENKYKRGI